VKQFLNISTVDRAGSVGGGGGSFPPHSSPSKVIRVWSRLRLAAGVRLGTKNY
jgi:hypothetical protein